MNEESMTSIERIEKAINLEEPDRVPVVPFLAWDMARYYGITVKEFMEDSKKGEAALDFTVNRLGGVDMIMGFPAAFSAMFYNPLSPVFSLYYCHWKVPGKDLPDDVLPQFDEKPVMNETDYERLIEEGLFSFFTFERAGALDLLKMRTLPRVMKSSYQKWVVERKVPIMMGGGALPPFDILSHMRGLPNFLVDLFRRPDKVIEASDWMIDGLIALGLQAAERIPSDTPYACKIMFQGSERSCADNITPEQFETFSLPYLKRMSEEFAHIGFYNHLHHHSNWTPFFEYFRDFPKKKCVMYLDDKSDIFKAKEILGDVMCLMGNVSASLLAYGTPRDVEKAVKEIIDKCAEGGGLIISTEDPPNCRFENLKALVDATKKYGVYKA